MKKHILYGIFILILLMTPICTFAEEEQEVKSRDYIAGRFLANYSTTFYNSRHNNFPGDEANAVIQTRDGYMWFGGYGGLYRYDGTKFTVWDAVSPDGFGSSNIRDLYEDADGVLWIGTNDKGLVAYKDGAFTVYDKSHGLPSNAIRTITGDGNGTIYCGTQEGLFRLEQDGTVSTISLNTQGQLAIYSICIDENGYLYVVLGTEGMYVYTPDGRTVGLPQDIQVHSVGSVSGSRVVAGTREGKALILQFDGYEFTRLDEKTTPLANINAVYQDSNGYIWLVAENGVGFLDTNENYQNVGDLSGEGFYSDMWEDYQNGYWIAGTRGGVTKLTVSTFSDFNALYQFETGAANAILMHNDDTYIGTNDGLYILDKDGKPRYTDFTSKMDVRVRGIFADSREDIWICTYSDLGLIRFTPSTGSFKNWTPENGMLTDRTRLVYELPNGVIVVGTATGLNFIKGDDIITVNEAFETEAFIELPEIMVLSMVYSNHMLYVGTDGNGVYAMDKNGTSRFREEDGLTGGVVLRMLPDMDNSGVWVGASPGLCYIDNSGQVSVIDKVPPYTFFDIIQYHEDIILLTSEHIIRTNADALLEPDSPYIYSSVGKSSGLNAQISANAWNVLMPDGSLYFCTDKGVGIYSFEKDITSFIPFAGIASVEIDYINHNNFNEKIIITQDAYRLTVELSFLSYGFVDDAALYYILIGQDEEPQTLSRTDNHNISYTNLKGGHYTLQVWTEDSSGNKGNFIEIGIYKELRFFERVYIWVIFGTLILALLGLLVYAIVRYRTRSLYEKQREYRTIISQALIAITNAIDAKDTYTSGHSARVAAYSAEIARRMGMDKDFIENLYYIGLMHDVGKIGIPNEIINKPDTLTAEEYEIMKNHSYIGCEILKDITAIHNLTAGAAQHHERWDGSGYYQQLAGEEISMEARIIAAADTYDAMSSDRSYRKALPKEVIYEEFKQCAGTQFDRQVAEIVLEMIYRDQFDSIDIEKIIGIKAPIRVQN